MKTNDNNNHNNKKIRTHFHPPPSSMEDEFANNNNTNNFQNGSTHHNQRNVCHPRKRPTEKFVPKNQIIHEHLMGDVSGVDTRCGGLKKRKKNKPTQQFIQLPSQLRKKNENILEKLPLQPPPPPLAIIPTSLPPPPVGVLSHTNISSTNGERIIVNVLFVFFF